MSAGSCPYCQAHAQPGVAYCSSCGQPLAAGGAGPQPWQQPAPYAAPVPQPEPQPQPQQPAPQINPMATVIAARAIDMAQLFAQILSQPFPGWRAEAVAPPGPSTGGGKQALQHLSLIAPSGGRLAIGQVRWTDNAASLRTHAVVDAMHRQRFGQPLPVAEAIYAAFLDRISLFLRG
ncbi:MAG: zinc ribbon domain-containing protein, partial [Deltaproteobacteria bacterium]|nr:zinc ribbon domain-containing protein [Deltaproteobacteria bacterium]